MTDTSNPSGSHQARSLAERVAEATEQLEEDGRPLLQWCEEALWMGQRLYEERAVRNRHQWRQFLRNIRMPRDVANRYMSMARSGHTADEAARFMAAAQAGFTADEVLELWGGVGDDKRGGEEADR